MSKSKKSQKAKELRNAMIKAGLDTPEFNFYFKRYTKEFGLPAALHFKSSLDKNLVKKE